LASVQALSVWAIDAATDFFVMWHFSGGAPPMENEKEKDYD
jgi:hypothetical protein